MEYAVSNQFVSLSQNELMIVDGGSGATDAAMVFAGAVAVAWSPVVMFFCPPAGIAMATLGSAGIIAGCGLDTDIISY